ncbi:MAG: N-acetylneuraminate synthase family protein [Candidatus Wildermuthbacteria bacterium]|nr:N-acetylneuraminate synthase family protein [Candidatus Wildermuthbacteria bacterium]
MAIDFNNLKEPYLVAEVGINHNGDLQIAKKLIDAAFSCNWNCVKFQKRTPEICVPENQKSVEKDTPWGKMTYLEYKKRIEFGKREYDYIDKYCKEKPIDWTASVWDIPSLEFIASYDVPFIKIPSAKLTDKELLVAAAKTGKPLMVSTGMSTIEEIDEASDILEKNKAQYVLMHCNSAYPTPVNELNLNCLKTLRERYKCPIGYSGHERDLEPTVYAAVLGARIFERHVTANHNMWGTDQLSSLEVTGMDMLRKRIKDVDSILGNGEKKVTEGEIPMRKKLRGVQEG